MSNKKLHLPSRFVKARQKAEAARQKKFEELADKQMRACVLFYGDEKKLAEYRQKVQQAIDAGEDPAEIEEPTIVGAEIFVSDQTFPNERMEGLTIVDMQVTNAMPGQDLAIEAQAMRDEIEGQAPDADISEEKGQG